MDTGRSNSASTYCVTGSTGYIGSWLVKSLLQKGCIVHATARDTGKFSSLLPLWNGGDRLKLFKADLSQEGSFDEAVKGCHGVFHVAASMEFNVLPTDNIENYVQSHILDPAIKGTLNLMKACSRENVKRVVFTSSISTMTAKDINGTWKSIVDESCRTATDQVWNMKPSGWVYVLSKILSEEAAFKFADENAIDLISIITTTVAGPFLTPTVPASVQILLSPITGEFVFNSILQVVNDRMGSISVVHIEDICNAHIFLMEHTTAKGPYICSAHSSVMSQLVDSLALEYPYSQIRRCRSLEGQHDSIPSVLSSEKLTTIGFAYKYGLKEILEQSIRCCVQQGFLKNPSNHDGNP
ncbi:hypothetical protein AQUCO_00500409v1 [Aquilegia coerulea]|uniref:NAD-dependent epimerase/dehydratase domain-containing protein n=1 Tax=Aquilegia coerulea TaxID=218851 RepID=A0A2G5ERT2_AQUCA|nr:hypothetical protein AQUCO_00500409v1 [Aquilegia coerulea]